MPLPSSGTISLSSIALEFGGTAPHSISEYYRGGAFVANTLINAAIPTSENFQGVNTRKIRIEKTQLIK